MAIMALQEQLTGRLEEFSRDALLSRADQACDLLKVLIDREGPVSLGANGSIHVGDHPMRAAVRELVQMIASSTNLFVGVYEANSLVVGNPSEIFQDEAPDEVQTVCVVRGEDFYGATELFGRACFVSAKPIVIDGSPRGFLLAGQFASESNNTLLGLSGIQSEIISLSEELQSDRQRSVGEFVKTIRSIAKRIHLLALNASILSAQAGEHGRGFSVVAREIGELAERTRQSTQELEQELLGKKRNVDVERRHGGRVGMLDKRGAEADGISSDV